MILPGYSAAKPTVACWSPSFVKDVMKKLSPEKARFKPLIMPPPVDVAISTPSSIHIIAPGSARTDSRGSKVMETACMSSPWMK